VVMFGTVRTSGTARRRAGEARESNKIGRLADLASRHILYVNFWFAQSALVVQVPQICFRVWRTAGRENEAQLWNVRVLVGPVNFGVSHAVVMACLSLYIRRNKLYSHEHICMSVYSSGYGCIFRLYSVHHSFSSLSYDRSKASSKASSPHSAIQSFLFQMRVSSPLLKVIQ